MPTAVAYPQGPLGRRRSIGVSILLAIVTIGIYTFVWVYKTHNEIKRHSGIGVGGVVGLVIYIVIGPVTYFVIPSEIRQMYEAAGRQSPVRGIYGLWILLPLIGPIIWFVQVQGALNQYWEWRGAPPPGTPQQTQPYATAPPPAPSAPVPPPPPPPPAQP
jgi:MFS family permease